MELSQAAPELFRASRQSAFWSRSAEQPQRRRDVDVAIVSRKWRARVPGVCVETRCKSESDRRIQSESIESRPNQAVERCTTRVHHSFAGLPATWMAKRRVRLPHRQPSRAVLAIVPHRTRNPAPSGARIPDQYAFES